MPARFHVPVPTLPLARRTTLAVSFAALSAAALLAGALGSADRAAGRDGETTLPSVGSLVADDSLDPRILDLQLSGRIWETAVDRLDAALFAHADAERRLYSSRLHLQQSRDELVEVRHDLSAAESDAASIQSEIEAIEDVLRRRAISLFVNHGEDDSSVLASPENAVTDARVGQLAAEVDHSQLETRARLQERQGGIESRVASLAARRLELETTLTSLSATVTRIRTDLDRLSEEIDAAADDVRNARRGARVRGLDISVVGLDAYLKAAVELADSRPRCGVEWWMIAGVGRVESRHGELGGRTVGEDGRTDRPIIGVVLDGGPGVRAVVDTDDGELDGDPTWDRAVGPMQFIPETWRIRSLDGNGDGVEDPHNLYDAALTTGRYLCQLGGDLRESVALREAYFGYNTSSAYVDAVHAHALTYAAFEVGEAPPSEPEDADT